jgi:two-component system, cell cycle response regulator DivK
MSEAPLILIVEDNEKNRRLVRDILQHKGYRTVEADNAEDGIVLARERHPHLILMDIQLPGMNGIQALALLRADPATRDIPAMAVTASVMSPDRERVMSAGFDRFHRKPLSLVPFLEEVAALLAKGAT